MQQDIVSQDLNKVLILSLGTLGDVVLNISALEAIRKYHPAAHIVLITEPEFKRLFTKCPFVDEVVTNWRSTGLRQDLNVTNQLQKAAFDIIYDLSQTDETEALYKRYWMKKPLFSGVVMGCSHPHVDRARDKMHVLDRIAEQLWLCGIGPAEGYPLGAAPLPNLNWALMQTDYANVPAKFGLDGNYAILIPEAAKNVAAQNGANGAVWPVSRYAELANQLAEHDIKPVLMGSHKALALGNEIRAQVRGVDDLIGRVDIFEYIAIVRNASLVVGTNSDLVIIAGITGAPTVSIINPEGANIRQVAPRGNLTVSLVARDFKEINVEQVINAARAVRD